MIVQMEEVLVLTNIGNRPTSTWFVEYSYSDMAIEVQERHSVMLSEN